MLYLKAISDNGCILLPAIIFKGEQIFHYYITYIDFLDNYILGIQTAGYLNNDYTFKQIKHFNKYSKAQ